MEKVINKPRDPIKYGFSDGDRVITFDPNLFEVCHACLGTGQTKSIKR